MAGIDRRTVYVLVALGLVALAVAGLVAGAFRDRTGPIGGGGAIAYSVTLSPGGTSQEAHVMNADGTDDRSIGRGCPAFSARGSLMTILTELHDPSLTVANADGSAARSLPGVQSYDFAVSPDGQQIAWVKSNGGRANEVWVTPISGVGGVRIVPPPSNPYETYRIPVWSPDGRHIAFSVMVENSDPSAAAYRSAVDVVDPTDLTRRRVTDRIGADTVAITWSPDSRYVAFLGLPDGSPSPLDEYTPWAVFVAGLDGTGDVQVTRDGRAAEQLRWSPDGGRLAFIALVDETAWHLATIPMAGPMPSGGILIGPENAGEFDWSPDGSRLAFVETIVPYNHSQPGESAIQTIDPAFLQPPTTLLDVPRAVGCLSWRSHAP